MSEKFITDAQVQPNLLAPFVIGAGWDQPFIAEDVLPPTNTYAQDFLYETWDNSGLVDEGSTKRALHAGSKILSPAKHGTVRAFLQEASAKIPLDINVLNAAQFKDTVSPVPAPGLSHADRERVGRMRKIAFNNKIQKEKDVASLVFTAGNYDAALQTTALSFKTCKISDIKDALAKVQQRCGFKPDTFVLGRLARASFDDNTNFMDRISGGATSTSPAVVTDQLLASLIGVKRVLVGFPVTQTIADPATLTATPTALWTEDSAALIYSGADFASSDLSSPAFGKVFYMDVPQTGLRYATWSWMDDEPNTVEWQKAAEYYLVAQTMKSGYYFGNADQ